MKIARSGGVMDAQSGEVFCLAHLLVRWSDSVVTLIDFGLEQISSADH